MGHQLNWIVLIGFGIELALRGILPFVGKTVVSSQERKQLEKELEQIPNTPESVIQVSEKIASEANLGGKAQQEPKQQFPLIPKTTDGTYVPPEATESERLKQMGQEFCELMNIKCDEDSRLKLKIDPTLQQDKPVLEKPKEKEENKPASSSSSGSRSDPRGAPVGSTACSWWSACIVKSATN